MVTYPRANRIAHPLTFLAIVVPMVLAGCSLLDGRSEHVVLSIDRQEYERGQTAQLTLRNGSYREIVVHPSLCGAALISSESASRVELYEACTAVILTLTHGEQVVTDHAIPDSLSPGSYRFVYELSGGTEVRSARFVVN